jgi:hypothetical protein
MSLLIMAGADLKMDVWIIVVGFAGGLVIESWGTVTEIWWYYTDERPPLWIIPAWPIASLSIDRLVRIFSQWLPKKISNPASRVPPATRPKSNNTRFFQYVYWLVFPSFYILMLSFVWHTIAQPFSILALILVGLLILSPTDPRLAVLTFAVGSALGYFLELWGTTRECWTYYTLETPPIFAVLAHGMAAVAFWRTVLLLKMLIQRLSSIRFQSRANKAF